MTWFEVAIMGGTTLVKLGLWVWCKAVFLKTSNVTVEAVSQDHWNDVLSNAAAIEHVRARTHPLT